MRNSSALRTSYLTLKLNIVLSYRGPAIFLITAWRGHSGFDTMRTNEFV